MTGDSTLLTKFEERAGPSITFGDDNKGYTLGYGLISKENVMIDEVALVEGLKHNFLSVNQYVIEETMYGSHLKPVLSQTKRATMWC